ncbi:MAG: putative tryptophan/tyrosine transport system substrate-binding protein [Candidatus Dependentiae bacterium]|nr:putative tryptophan/tyrosine transport system substrate-binding protein [Candidatus Dependentiae bacterium]
MGKQTTILICGIGIAAAALLIAWNSHSGLFYKSSYTIGLVYMPARAFHEYANKVLIDQIKADRRFTIKEFTAASGYDPVLMATTCNEAIESDADILITTGIQPSQGIAQASQRRCSNKPVIFFGILDPVKNGIIDSREKPGKNMTGIESNSSGNNEFLVSDLLLIAKPNTKKILLPYAIAAGGNEEYVRAIEKSVKKQGLSITLLPIDTTSEVMAKVATLLPGHDVLMYLEGDAIAVYGTAFGKLASQHGITLFAGSIDGMDDAALIYTSDPASLAKTAFGMAKEVLLNNKNPASMQIQQAIVERNLVINTHLCQEQDLGNINIKKIIEKIRADNALAAVHDHIKVRNIS